MNSVYYVVLSSGTPVDVSTIWANAEASRKSFDSPARPATIVPVSPLNMESRPYVDPAGRFDLSDCDCSECQAIPREVDDDPTWPNGARNPEVA